jgi:hypothetical protein
LRDLIARHIRVEHRQLGEGTRSRLDLVLGDSAVLDLIREEKLET